MNEEFQRHLQLGRHLHHSRVYDRAVRELEAALAIEPDSNFTRLILARALHGLKRTKEARLEVETVLRSNPDEADGHYMASFLESSPKKALASIDSALRVAPLNVEYHVHRAYLLMRLSRYRESLEGTRHALELDPDSARAHRQHAASLFNEARNAQWGMGRLGLRGSQRDEAARHVAAALRLEPDNPYSHVVEAHLHFFDREYETSVEKWQEALRLDPTDKYARHHLRQAKGQVQFERFITRLWNTCFAWMPWPVPLPLTIGLTVWSLRWNICAFVELYTVMMLMLPIMIRDWLRFVPDRVLGPVLLPFKNPPLR